MLRNKLYTIVRFYSYDGYLIAQSVEEMNEMLIEPTYAVRAISFSID